jgi:hypothetical protein
MTALAPAKPRSDLLCTVVLLADGRFADAPGMLSDIAAFLAPRFQFSEILVLAPQDVREAHRAVFDTVVATPGVRVLLTRRHVHRYRLMPLAAAQSIGDVVLFVADDEYGGFDLSEIWSTAERTGHSVRLRGKRAGLLDRVGAAMLSRLVGFTADPQTLRSGVHFRDRLTWLLERSDGETAFRFPQSWATEGETMTTLAVADEARHVRHRTLFQRALLAADLVSEAAPRLLKLVAVTSLLGVGGSLFFSAYAVALFFLRDDLAEGWFSTSLAIAGSTGFVCAALGSIALGLARLLDLRLSHPTDDILLQTSGPGPFDGLEMLNVVSER